MRLHESPSPFWPSAFWLLPERELSRGSHWSSVAGIPTPSVCRVVLVKCLYACACVRVCVYLTAREIPWSKLKDLYFAIEDTEGQKAYVTCWRWVQQDWVLQCLMLRCKWHVDWTCSSKWDLVTWSSPHLSWLEELPRQQEPWQSRVDFVFSQGWQISASKWYAHSSR